MNTAETIAALKQRVAYLECELASVVAHAALAAELVRLDVHVEAQPVPPRRMRLVASDGEAR